MKSLVLTGYTLFKSYSARRPLDICTDCCMSLSNEERLSKLPVHEIPKELLMEYNDGAATDRTPIDELKHFLPRYLELIANFDFPSHSLELCLKRLNPYNEAEWTHQEYDFLTDFSLTFFKTCLAQHPLPDGEEIDSILLMFWKGRFPLSPLLDYWKSDRSLTSTLHFSELYLNGFKRNNSYKLLNSFGDAEVSKVVRDWIDSESVRTAFKGNIERIIIGDEEEDYFKTNDLNILYQQLDALK